VCGGIGELWFESDEAMTQALNSAEMAAAVEDAKNFLDMEKTGLVIVR
jgi:EthD domain